MKNYSLDLIEMGKVISKSRVYVPTKTQTGRDASLKDEAQIIEIMVQTAPGLVKVPTGEGAKKHRAWLDVWYINALNIKSTKLLDLSPKKAGQPDNCTSLQALMYGLTGYPFIKKIDERLGLSSHYVRKLQKEGVESVEQLLDSGFDRVQEICPKLTIEQWERIPNIASGLIAMPRDVGASGIGVEEAQSILFSDKWAQDINRHYYLFVVAKGPKGKDEIRSLGEGEVRRVMLLNLRDLHLDLESHLKNIARQPAGTFQADWRLQTQHGCGVLIEGDQVILPSKECSFEEARNRLLAAHKAVQKRRILSNAAGGMYTSAEMDKLCGELKQLSGTEL